MLIDSVSIVTIWQESQLWYLLFSLRYLWGFPLQERFREAKHQEIIMTWWEQPLLCEPYKAIGDVKIFREKLCGPTTITKLSVMHTMIGFISVKDFIHSLQIIWKSVFIKPTLTNAKLFFTVALCIKLLLSSINPACLTFPFFKVTLML